MDGCAIIDARRRESTEPGPLWRANATTTGNVQTGAWKIPVTLGKHRARHAECFSKVVHV